MTCLSEPLATEITVTSTETTTATATETTATSAAANDTTPTTLATLPTDLAVAETPVDAAITTMTPTGDCVTQPLTVQTTPEVVPSTSQEPLTPTSLAAKKKEKRPCSATAESKVHGAAAVSLLKCVCG